MRLGSVLIVLILFAGPAPISWAQSLDVKVTIQLPDENRFARLYNFQTNQYNIIRQPSALSRNDCLNYLPENVSGAVGLLDQLIAKGHSPYRALTIVQFRIASKLKQQ